MHFNIKLHLRIGLPSSLFPSGVITGTWCHVIVRGSQVMRLLNTGNLRASSLLEAHVGLEATGHGHVLPQTVQFIILWESCRSLQWKGAWSDVAAAAAAAAANCKTQIVWRLEPRSFTDKCRRADKSLARPGRKQVKATEVFGFHVSYL
jgi:hypothetical protein